MERNYKEDQTNEIEALESIYCDDFESKSNHYFHNIVNHSAEHYFVVS